MPKSLFKLFSILFLSLFAFLFLQPEVAFARLELRLASPDFDPPTPPYVISIGHSFDIIAATADKCENSGDIEFLVSSQALASSQPTIISPRSTFNPPITFFGLLRQENATAYNPSAPGQYYIYAKCKVGNVYSDKFDETDLKTVTVYDPASLTPTPTPTIVPALGSRYCDPRTGADTGVAGQGISTAIGCVPTRPIDFIAGTLKLAASIGGGIALLLMIAGAFQMITSSGNPDNLKKGQQQFTSAIIGLLFIIFAVLFLQVVGVDILNIPGFGK